MVDEPLIETPRTDLVAAAPHVRRYLRFLGCEREALDDLAQETLLAGVRHWPAGEAPLPWLFTTARHCLLLHWRARGRAREHTGADLDRLHGMWVEQAGDDAGDAMKRALRECLAGLPARSRQLVQLRYEHELDREAIAGELGLGAEGVKSLLVRVRETLAACVKRRMRHD